MWGWCIETLASARLKASVRFPPLRGMYQRGGTCKGCDTMLGKIKVGSCLLGRNNVLGGHQR